MANDWSQIEIHEGAPRLLSNGVAVDTIIQALVSGESLDATRKAFGVYPADLVAVLGFQALGADDALGLPLTMGKPSHPRLTHALGEKAWEPIFPQTPRTGRLALSAGLLQIFDEWNASHEAAQEADDLGERAYSAYWHAIAHRREPDAGNASYWFRRVGRHPVYSSLAESAVPLLEERGDSSLAKKLINSGQWNPNAFVDLCGNGRPRPEFVTLARRLQRLEMRLLLEATSKALED